MNLQQGLVGHWTMDSRDVDNGMVRDRSAYDRDGDLRNSPITGINAPVGQGFQFDGNDQYVRMPQDNYSGAFSDSDETVSVSCWIRPTGLATNSTNHSIQNCWMAHSSSSYNDNFEAGVDASTNDIQVYFDCNSADTQNTSTGVTAPLNRWTHVVITFTTVGTPTMKLYKNGNLELTDTSTWSGADTLDQAGAELTFAASRSYREPFTGQISEGRLYSRVLSESEVKALYNERTPKNSYGGSSYGGEGVVTGGQILHLNARRTESYDGTGNVWYDISGNGYDAYGDPNSSGSGTDSSRFPEYRDTNYGSFYFDGSKGLTITDTMPDPSELTIEAWVWRPDSGDYISDARNGNGNWHLTNYSSHNINFGNSLQADDPPSYQADSNWWRRWTHIVATSDGSNSRLFIDGTEITDSRLNSSGGFQTGLGQYFRIGNRYTSSGRWNGYMSTYRLYNKRLTAEQARQNYRAESKYHIFEP